MITIEPGRGDTGWWTEGDTYASHLDDSFLYAGFFNGQPVLSAVRFDLQRVRRGAPIPEATMNLTGLNADRFHPEAGGTWTVQLLDPKAVPDAVRADFQTMYNAPAAVTLFPTLYPSDLAAGQGNTFALDKTARAWLELQALDGATAVLARILGHGDATRAALVQFEAHVGPRYALDTYNLLGDPALEMRWR
jgi:hypothetical protein